LKICKKKKKNTNDCRCIIAIDVDVNVATHFDEITRYHPTFYLSELLWWWNVYHKPWNIRRYAFNIYSML